MEQEKLFYFVLTSPQKIVLIKSGDKNEEKEFLGYEFSFAKGKEGIHPIRRGKKLDGADLAIDDCTQLFDPIRFDNPEKASTYIYKAFQGDFTSKLNSNVGKHVSRLNLVDMLLFDRIDFSKSISLVIKKKVASKWKFEKLGKICDIKIGATPSRDNYAFYDKGSNLWVSISEMNSQIIFDTKEKLSDLGVSKSSVKLIKKGTTLLSFKLSIGKVAIAGADLYTNEAIAGLQINDEYKDKILDKFIFIIFKQKFIDLEKGGFNAFGKSLNSTFLNEDVKIPFPPIDIQQKIINEIEEIEKRELILINKGVSLENSITNKFKDLGFDEENLGNITFFKNGLNYSRHSTGEFVDIIGVKDFQNRFVPDLNSIEKIQIDGKLSEEYNLRPGDILVVRSNGSANLVGRFLFIEKLNGITSFSGFTIRIRPNSEMVVISSHIPKRFKL